MFKTINGGRIPQRATKYSAGFDVFANEDVVIGAGETKVIGLGICIEDDLFNYLYRYDPRLDMSYDSDDCMSKVHYFMTHHYFMLCLRSSLGVKGLSLPNGHGVIDIDYKDEIKMIITNLFNPHICAGADYIPLISTTPYEIKRGDKIGQLILKRHEGWLLSAEYTKDEERNGGFGSTS